MNLSRHQFLGRLINLLRHGRARLGNFHRQSSGRRRPESRGRHVLDVIVKSSRQEKLERARRWRRGLQWGGLAAAVAVLVTSSHQALARYFWQNPDFRIGHSVEIRTNGSLTHDDILRHGGLNEQTHVYDVDLRAVRERLEALPNVKHASVERELPGRLVVDVDERLPVMWLTCARPQLEACTTNAEKGGRLLDEDGHLFLCTELRDDLIHIPILNVRRLNQSHPGAHLTTATVQAGLKLLQRLRDTFGPRGLDVTEIDAPNDWSLVAKLTNDLVVTFGHDQLEDQLDRLRRVFDVAEEGGLKLRTVNLLPRKNVPVTFVDGGPRAAAPGSPAASASVPVSGQPATPAEAKASHQAAQLEDILGGGR